MTAVLSDFELARLPVKEAQEALAGAGHGAAVRALLGWHGQAIDARLGSYALVADDGPCAGLVGSRIKVSPVVRGRAPVFAYVILAVEGALLAPAEVTVTRRLFMELALPSTFLPVRVEVVVP